MFNVSLCLFGVFFCIFVVSADLSKTFQYCCGLGRNKALDPLKCKAKTFSPIINVRSDQQNICSSTIDLCCLQYWRDTSCKHGKQAAKVKASCDKELKTDEDASYKYCCEACKLGIVSGSAGNSCELNNTPFGSPWSEVFTSCCFDTPASSKNASQIPSATTLRMQDMCSLHSGELCSQICIPVYGSYRCGCKPGYSLMPDSRSCREDTKRCENFNPCQHKCHDNGVSVRCSCNEGYELLPDNRRCAAVKNQTSGLTCATGFRLDLGVRTCVDIDECKEGSHSCEGDDEKCENLMGSYKCIPIKNMGLPNSKIRSCIPGYKFESKINDCVDINECETSPCNSNEICVNTVGSYRCNCASGFQEDHFTGACIDINECQLNSHNCDISSQRCDNTIGSFHCVRFTGCGTGYTFNSETSNCEDDDECLLGTDNCKYLGPEWECRNTLGSFRCEKKRCDLQNCTKVPLTATKCPRGFELNHKGSCDDIDECKKPLTCLNGLKCTNTVGSYLCTSPKMCKDGLRLNETTNQCVDIDECVEQPNICDHNCVNVWGSFACTCYTGFLLHQDNRSCVDVNECDMFKERRLCMGTCANIPGSYKCQCPDGYRLGQNAASCQDIDECSLEVNKCSAEETCLNMRGSYRCYAIECPQNYVRDPVRKNRCSRASYYCQYVSEDCLQTPISYSFNYLALSSNLAIPITGMLELFSMRGPQSGFTSIDFTLEIDNVRAPHGVPRVNSDYFFLNIISWNSVTVTLKKSIIGPQDIELHLKMNLYSNDAFAGFTISKLFIYVSQYDF